MKALLSVSNKTNLIELANLLHQNKIELISTGGTQKILSQAGLPVKNISTITHFPEILDGRLKTLHPKIHGALLGKSTAPKHLLDMELNQIERIDFLIVTLYPFKETISNPASCYDEIIENIDIGGPAMLRSAAKNYEDVVVLCDPNDYLPTITLWQQGLLTLTHRKQLAAKVFRLTAQYDSLIATYLTEDFFPETLTLSFDKLQDLRYGENPHQKAAFYKHPLANQGLTNARQLHGKPLSFNNIVDANAALELLNEFSTAAAVAVKHTNPCGVGLGSTVEEAFNACYQADSVSIFGGIVAVNATVNETVAHQLSNIFLEVIIAPSFTAKALAILSTKKNIRLLQFKKENAAPTLGFTAIDGGLLLQEKDTYLTTPNDCRFVTHKQIEADVETGLFLWKVVKHVKSNAIVVGNSQRTLGIGAGQMNRVGSVKLALEQAGSLAKGAVLVSDAFFPMADSIELAAQYGIQTIFQPSGSIKDEAVIAAANQNNMAMVFMNTRHFRH